MTTPFEFDPAYNCHSNVQVGSRRPVVISLQQALTYGGLLEGFPTKAHNDRFLEQLRASLAAPGTCLIEPARRPYLRTPGDMDRHAEVDRLPEWLPMVTVTMALRYPGIGGPSELQVVFYQDEFAPPLADDVAAALKALDWDRRAQPATWT